MSKAIIDAAIKKITIEANKQENNPLYLQISEHIINKITNVAAAEKVLDEKKSLSEAIKGITNEAQKRKVGNCAYIPPEEVFKMACDYFGIKEEDNSIIDVTEMLV